MIRILSFDSTFCFPRLVYMTLVMLDTPANARLQKFARDLGYLSDLRRRDRGRAGCKSTKEILVNTTEQCCHKLRWVNTGTVTWDAPKLELRIIMCKVGMIGCCIGSILP
jgi:hypothetical protein